MTWLGRQRVGRRYSSTHSQTRARRRWVVRSTLQLIYPGKDPCPFYRKLGGPRGRVGRHEKSRPHRNSIHGTSSPLYRLRFWMYTKHNSTNLRLLQDTHFVKYIYIYLQAFTVSIFNKILPGWQPRQVAEAKWRFRARHRFHHQDYNISQSWWWIRSWFLACWFTWTTWRGCQPQKILLNLLNPLIQYANVIFYKLHYSLR